MMKTRVAPEIQLPLSLPQREFNQPATSVQQGGGGGEDATFPHAPIEALYVHIPFCFHKCHYCDFYSLVEHAPGQRDRQGPFVQALIREIQHKASVYEWDVKTIFVGGGTPTLLRPALWRDLLQAMRKVGLLDRVEEFTVEANPETVTGELMAILAAGGVNRVSMGAQSFNPKLLKMLERWHDPASVGRAARRVRDAGIDNINLDLIFAIPGQTLEDLDADLDAALALKPSHLSCYNLMYEPNTAMTMKLRLGRITPVTQETEAAMYERVMDRLDQAGFEQYEISNWARTQGRGARGEGRGIRSRDQLSGLSSLTPHSSPLACHHNLAYWTSRNWLGVGPSASSHVDGRRWKNLPNLGRYITSSPTVPVVDDERLPTDRRVGEQLMLRLRLTQGAAEGWLKEHLPEADPRWAAMEEMIGLGLLERDAAHLRLTRRGVFVADEVTARLL